MKSRFLSDAALDVEICYCGFLFVTQPQFVVEGQAVWSNSMEQASKASGYRFRYFDALVGAAPIPGPDAFASGRTPLRRGFPAPSSRWNLYTFAQKENGVLCTVEDNVGFGAFHVNGVMQTQILCANASKPFS